MKIDVPFLFEQTMQSMIYCVNERELFNLLSTAVKALEFDYYAYGVRIPSPVTKPAFSLKSNYTNKWQVRYTDKNYIAIDPTVKHGLVSTRPLVWSNIRRQEQPEFWEEASSHGLMSGWAQSSILSQGSIGMLTVAQEEKGSTTKHILHRQPLLVWLHNIFKTAYSEIVLPDMFKCMYLELTSRETEMLKWCADGKTSDEIAIILDLKKRTVDFHIANAINKLNVTNKTAAAVKAIQLNII
jgi:LuxR family quorum-sensing system transcriptional regulator SolR